MQHIKSSVQGSIACTPIDDQRTRHAFACQVASLAPSVSPIVDFYLRCRFAMTLVHGPSRTSQVHGKETFLWRTRDLLTQLPTYMFMQALLRT